MNIWVVPPVRVVNGPLPVPFRAGDFAAAVFDGGARLAAVPAVRACPTCSSGHVAANVDYMGSKRNGELEGQSSINELLDQPIGDKPIQLPLPIHLEVRPGDFRRAS